jgi:GTP cyclohydrolase I
LPFFGVAHVAYLPNRRLAGLSKLGRVVDAHARRLQTQEELTRAVVETIRRRLEPVGAIALLEAEHTCMTLRGVRKETSRMLTVAATGVYESDPGERAQILHLLNSGGRSVSLR